MTPSAREPLMHATPAQRESYATWCLRLADKTHGRMAERLREIAGMVTGGFYA